jgi:hypothetical protein
MKTQIEFSQDASDLDEGLQKAIALLIFTNTPYFIHEGSVYEGSEYDLEGAKDISNFVEVEPIEGEERDNYMILNDDEANEKEKQSLDSYLEECIYPGLSGNLADYFDEEAWKRDARMDGRGSSINSYDGAEHEVNVDGTWYYIYRMSK